MPNQDRGVQRDGLAQCMASWDPLTRAQAFQILDTAFAHLAHYGFAPGLATLQIPPSAAHATAILQPYLSGLTALELSNELAGLAHFRPKELAMLPLLPPRLPTSADVQARIAQQSASQTTLPTLADLPAELKDHATFSMVQNYQHALAIEADLLAVNNKKGPAAVADADDAPQDQTTWRTMKDELCAAIVDFAKTAEMPGSSRYKQVEGLKNVEVEVIASKLLEATIQAQNGNIGIPGDKPGYEKYPTLNERLDEVKRAVRNSKCCVASMMSVANLDFAKRLAAHPVGELDTKVSNALLNKQKANKLKAAKKATETGDATKQHDGTITYRDGSQFTAAPNAVEEELKASLPHKRKRNGNGAVPVPNGSSHQTPAQQTTPQNSPIPFTPAQRAELQLAPSYRLPVQHNYVQHGPGQHRAVHFGPVQYHPVQHSPRQPAAQQIAPVCHEPPPRPPAPMAQYTLDMERQHMPTYSTPTQPHPAQHCPVQQPSFSNLPAHQFPMQQVASQHTSFHDITSGINIPDAYMSAEDTAAENLPAQNEREAWEDWVTYTP